LALNLTYLYVFFVPFEYLFFKLFESTTIFKPQRILGITLVLVWLIGMFQKQKKIVIDVYDKSLAFIFIFGLTITFLRSIWSEVNFAWALNESLLIFYSLFVYLAIKNMNLDEKQLIIILNIFLVACIINSFFMIIEFNWGGPIYRAQGISRSPAQAGYISAIAISILMSTILFRIKRIMSLPGVTCFGLILLLSYSLFISGSRGSVLGLIAAVMSNLYLILKHGYTKGTIFKSARFIVLIILLLVLVLLGTNRQVTNSKRYNVAKRYEIDRIMRTGRLDTWRSAFNVATDSWFLGVGLAQYRHFHLDYISKLLNIHSPTVLYYSLVVHSDYLSLLTEYGIFCLIVYILVILSILRGLFSAAEKFSHKSYIYPTLLGVFVFLITHGIFRNSFNIASFFLFWAFAISAMKLSKAI